MREEHTADFVIIMPFLSPGRNLLHHFIYHLFIICFFLSFHQHSSPDAPPLGWPPAANSLMAAPPQLADTTPLARGEAAGRIAARLREMLDAVGNAGTTRTVGVLAAAERAAGD